MEENCSVEHCPWNERRAAHHVARSEECVALGRKSVRLCVSGTVLSPNVVLASRVCMMLHQTAVRLARQQGLAWRIF